MLWNREYHRASDWEGWRAAEARLAAHPREPFRWPYRWVRVSMSHPERVRIWQMRVGWIFSTRANTGIDRSTPIGSWPVAIRYQVTSMQGRTPDGVSYNDPHIYWVNYFHGNDALHAYPRAAYGFPQSAGCVEVSMRAGARIFRLLHRGTVVTIDSQ